MKTILYTFLLVFSSAFAFAQVHVTPPNGHVGVGTETPTQKLDVNGSVHIRGRFLDLARNTGSGNVYLRVGKDRTANGHAILDLISRTEYNVYGLRLFSHTNGRGYIDHQSTQPLYIRNIQSAPMYFMTSANQTRMFIHQSGKIGIGTINPDEDALLHVKGSIAHEGTVFLASDKRLKYKESKFDYGLDEVLALSPIYYNYNGKAGTNAKQTHVGLYAQDLKKAAPKLVGEFTYQETEIIAEDEEGIEFEETTKAPETYLKINESAIKYMLINAVKEQQTIIEDLRQEVAELRDIVENGDSQTGSKRSNSTLDNRQPVLKQNTPNPFSSKTLVRYYVPADTQNAAVKIYDSNGKLIYDEAIRGTGEGNIQIEAGTLPAGTYNYSLLIDGKVFDTKQMVIVR